MKVTDQLGQLPLPPFADLYRQKECVRQALLAYLYLNKVRRSTTEFKGFETVIEILEEAIINLDLREKVRRHVELILSLCAEPIADKAAATSATLPENPSGRLSKQMIHAKVQASEASRRPSHTPKK